MPDIVDLLPQQLKEDNNRPTVTYKLGPSIRNKILNYKDTVNSIKIDNDNLYNTENCDCLDSEFCDSHYGHIITGDLRIVENSKLRKLLSKGPNFREPKMINFKHCRNSIITALDQFINKNATKFKIDMQNFIPWKDKIICAVDKKINNIKHYKYPRITRPLLKQKHILDYLEKLHSRFVIVPIDKASNNVAFICKSFYIKTLLKEVGIIDSPSDTYEVSALEPLDVIHNNIKICNRFGLNVNETQKKFPIMYWMPKKHKTPTGARFIVASSNCSTKPLSKVISSVFKLIFDQVNHFHLKSKFYSNLNMFWVVQNSSPIKDKIDKINNRNNAKCISTFDFSTLYTKIAHKDLLKELNKVIDFVFDGGSSKYIAFNDNKAFWSNTRNGKYFTRSSLKDAVKHLICESFFQIGNKLIIQKVGIPMGIDPAPFWANLYLHRHEYDFILDIKSSNIIRAKKFHGCFRFIDDMCCLNNGGEFGKSFLEIYPEELELKCEHSGNHATFLDLDIRIEDGMFIYKLYDKRDGFPFHIVWMPNHESNIPSYIFYGTILSEYLRIARSTLRFEDFLPKVVSLAKRMLVQGAHKIKLFKQMNKAMASHPDVFVGFSKTPHEIVKNIEHLLA